MMMSKRQRAAIPSQVQVPMPRFRSNDDDALACSALVSEVMAALNNDAEPRLLGEVLRPSRGRSVDLELSGLTV